MKKESGGFFSVSQKSFRIQKRQIPILIKTGIKEFGQPKQLPKISSYDIFLKY